MTMHFSVTRLANQRALVKGEDFTGTTGAVTLATHEWDDVLAEHQFEEAQAEFADIVEDFFRPISDAADRLTKNLEKPVDPITVVGTPPTEGTPGTGGYRNLITVDAQILHAIEVGAYDRLIWTSPTSLELTEYVAQDVAIATVEQVLGGEVIEVE